MLSQGHTELSVLLVDLESLLQDGGAQSFPWNPTLDVRHLPTHSLHGPGEIDSGGASLFELVEQGAERCKIPGFAQGQDRPVSGGDTNGWCAPDPQALDGLDQGVQVTDFEDFLAGGKECLIQEIQVSTSISAPGQGFWYRMV